MRYLPLALPRPHAIRPPACVAAVVVLLAALSVAPARAADVATVKTSDLPAYDQALKGFRERYGGGIDVYDLGRAESADALAAQVRAARPKVVFTIGSKASMEMARRLKDVPLVFCMVLAPQKRGLTGPNVTGVALEIPAREQLRQFKRVVPGLKRVGIIFNPAKTEALVREARAAARAVGVTLVTLAVSGPGEVPDGVKALVKRVDGLWLIPDASVVTLDTFKNILLVSLERKLPLMVFSVAFVKAGALLGVVPDYPAIGAKAADLVKEILAGSVPGNLEVRDPPSGIVINGTTAARIGVRLRGALREDATIVK